MWTHDIARLRSAFGYSIQGLKAAWKEPAFRLETLIAVPALTVGLWAGDTPGECAVLAMSILLVPIVELLNTAVEAAIDRVSIEPHPLSKIAKDVASAAVLLAIINAALVWALVVFG